MGLLAVPWAAVRCPESLDDARHGAKRREIRERLERREHKKATGGTALGFGQRGVAVRIEELDWVRGGGVRAREHTVSSGILSVCDRVPNRKKQPVEGRPRLPLQVGA